MKTPEKKKKDLKFLQRAIPQTSNQNLTKTTWSTRRCSDYQASERSKGSVTKAGVLNQIFTNSWNIWISALYSDHRIVFYCLHLVGACQTRSRAENRPVCFNVIVVTDLSHIYCCRCYLCHLKLSVKPHVHHSSWNFYEHRSQQTSAQALVTQQIDQVWMWLGPQISCEAAARVVALQKQRRCEALNQKYVSFTPAAGIFRASDRWEPSTQQPERKRWLDS